MKEYIISILLVFSMILSGCGGTDSGTPEATAVPETAVPAETEAPVSAQETAVPDRNKMPEEPVENEAASKARELIGEDVEALYEAIGYPESSEYAPSCMGPGDDGELHYDGFTVYTYREGDTESVYDVD